MHDTSTDIARRTLLGAAALGGLGLALAGCAAEEHAPARAGLGRPDAERPSAHPGPSPEPESGARAAGTLLLATLARGDEIAIIDPVLQGTGAVVDTVRVGAAPWGAGVSPDGRTAYAATAEGLAVVDLASRTRTGLVPYRHPAPAISSGEYRAGGLGLAVAPDGSRVYVAVTDGSLSPGSSFLEVYDVETAAFTASVAVGIRPFDVLVAPDGAWAATVDHDGFSVTVVDARTLDATTHRVAPFGRAGGLASWEKPHYGAVADDGAILLPYQGLVVARLDPVSGEITMLESRADSHAHGTALAGPRLVTVGTGAFGNARSGPNLSILDLETGRERIVPLDPPHETVAIWRDASGAEFAAVAGGNTRDAGWDGITVVPLDATAEEAETHRRIPTPGYPQVVVGFADRSGVG